MASKIFPLQGGRTQGDGRAADSVFTNNAITYSNGVIGWELEQLRYFYKPKEYPIPPRKRNPPRSTSSS